MTPELDGFRLRPATMDDGRMLWRWRNDRVVRRYSLTRGPVAWTTHRRWLAQRLTSQECRMWVLEQAGRPVGQIRYDRAGNRATISLSVAREDRGRGLGTLLLKRSVPLVFRSLGVRRLVGLVTTENPPSQWMFRLAGFVPTATLVRRGRRCIQFERRRGGHR